MMLKPLTASGFVVDSVAVESEALMCCVDADGIGAVFKQRHLQGLCVTAGHVGVALHMSRQLGGVVMA